MASEDIHAPGTAPPSRNAARNGPETGAAQRWKRFTVEHELIFGTTPPLMVWDEPSASGTRLTFLDEFGPCL